MRFLINQKHSFQILSESASFFLLKKGEKIEGGKQTFCLHVHYEPFFLFV